MAKKTTTKAKQISKENYSPVYGIFGNEYLLRDRFINNIRNCLLDEETKDLSHDRYDAKEDSADTIISSANSFPMLSSLRLVEVKSVSQLTSKELEPYLKYIQNPNESNCVLLIGESVDKKKKFFKELDKKGYLHTFASGNKRQILNLIKTELKEAGFQFSNDVPALIRDLLGSQDLGLAINKLMLFKMDDKEIGIDDVFNTIGTEGNAAIFQFVDYVFYRKMEDAFLQLKLLFANKESPLMILSLLVRQLRFILLIKDDPRTTPKGAPPFLLPKLNSFSRSFNYNQLYNWHSHMYKTDKLLKSSKADGKLIFDNLLFNLFMNKPTENNF
jgi:DNA polymerase III subunit delta